MEVKEIRDWIQYQKTTRHAKRLTELKEDRSFFEDTFNMPFIKDEKYRVRLGFVSSLLNNITQQMVSNKPRVFTTPKTPIKEAGSKRIASICNKQMKTLSTYPDNPFDISFKDTFMGESWLYTPHMEQMVDTDWRENYPNIIPCHFLRVDPMVMFSDPNEEIDGIPTQCAIYFDQFASTLMRNNPMWKGTKPYANQEKVPYVLYFNSEFSYAEADGIPYFMNPDGTLINGEGKKDNLYGFVPFVHSYSGWGYSNETRDPDLLSFSRIRMIRDKIILDSTMASDFQKNIHDYAWKHRVMKIPMGVEMDMQAALAQYSPDEENSFSVIQVPQGGDVGVEESKLFSGEVFVYRNSVKNDLSNEFPQVLQGNDIGSSGRNLDVAGYLGLSLYDCCLNNTAQLWSKALNSSLKICDILTQKKTDMLPLGMKEGDSDSYSELTVDLQKETPNDLSRKAQEALTAYNAHTISLKTYLIEGRNMTDEESDKEISAMLAFNAMSTHPFFADRVAQEVARAQGLGAEFEQFKASMGGVGEGIKPKINYGAEGGEPRTGNVQTLQGLQMAGMGGNEPRVGAR